MKKLILLIIFPFSICLADEGGIKGNPFDTQFHLHKIKTGFKDEQLMPVDFEKTISAWKTTEHLLKTEDFISWKEGRLVELLRKSFWRMLKKNKIYQLTPEIRKNTRIDSKFCHRKRKPDIHAECARIEAFYMPEHDLIFIDDNLPLEKFAPLLFHEILHVYQYTYRLPWDASAIRAHLNIADGEDGDKKFLEYLTFHYESLAHWYTLTLFKDFRWIDLVPVWSEFAGAATRVFSGLFLTWFFKPLYGKYPDETPDYIQEIYPPTYHNRVVSKQKNYSGGHSAIEMPRPVHTNWSNTGNIRSTINFDFGRKLIKRLSEELHGDPEKFIPENIPEAVKLQKAFNESYIVYASWILYPEKEQLEQCENFYRYFDDSTEAPLFKWQTLIEGKATEKGHTKQSLFEECQYLGNIRYQAYRKKWMSAFANLAPDSKYVIDPGTSGTIPDINFRPGTSGTIPDLNLKPAISVIMPQVDLVP